MASIVVGLTGYKQSGKDTLGSILVENYGWRRVGLADAVKEAAYALNPIIGFEGGVSVIRLKQYVTEYGWDAAKANPEVRRLLDSMGTEVGRDMFGLDCWTDIAYRKIHQIHGPVVVTDVRFANEADLCDLVIRIKRESAPLDPSLISEVSVDSVPANYVIHNDYGLDALGFEAKKITSISQPRPLLELTK